MSGHKQCPDANRILNPVTGRCVLKTSELGKLIIMLTEIITEQVLSKQRKVKSGKQSKETQDKKNNVVTPEKQFIKALTRLYDVHLKMGFEYTIKEVYSAMAEIANHITDLKTFLKKHTVYLPKKHLKLLENDILHNIEAAEDKLWIHHHQVWYLNGEIRQHLTPEDLTKVKKTSDMSERELDWEYLQVMHKRKVAQLRTLDAGIKDLFKMVVDSTKRDEELIHLIEKMKKNKEKKKKTKSKINIH